MSTIQHIKNIVKYHRKKAGLSQKGLADISGVGKTIVFVIVKGKETVQLKSILKIFEALNITIQFDTPLMDKFNPVPHENS